MHGNIFVKHNLLMKRVSKIKKNTPELISNYLCTNINEHVYLQAWRKIDVKVILVESAVGIVVKVSGASSGGSCG